MLEREWFEITKTTAVSVEDWTTVTVVYQWHPLIGEVTGKQDIGKLYRQGGMGIIRSMLIAAYECRDAELAVTSAAKRVNDLCRKRDEIVAKLNQEIDWAKIETQELADGYRALKEKYGK